MPVLTGRYALGDLTGRAGEVLRFTPSTTIVGPDVVVLPDPVTVELDSDGAFSVELVGTDDPAYAPSGWVWVVQELMDGGRPAWAFELTADADLSELAATVVPGDYDLLVPTSRTLTAGAGLTGGGTLAADRTFTVGEGTGITVNADDVAVDTSVIATRAYSDASQAAAEDTAAGALASHEADTTSVHGIADTAALVLTGDARLTDARTPTAHAASHAAAGTDAVTVAESQVTGLTAALAAKADDATTITAGNGLTGGGTLAADRTLAVGAGTGITVNADDIAVAYGTSAGTAAQGNDSRLPTVVAAPTDFAFNALTIPPISRLGSGRFLVDINLEAMRPAAGVTYYVSPTGTVGNSGLTSALPTTIATAQGKADVGTIIFAPGEYDRVQGTSATSKSINYLAAAPGVKITAFNPVTALTWTLQSGAIYTTSRSATAGVFDTVTRTSWGDYTKYTKVADLASISAEGQWAIVGSNVYVWALGSTDLSVAENRTQIRLAITSINGLVISGGTSYVRGIEFEGHISAGGLLVSGTALVIAEECTFRYANAVGAVQGTVSSRIILRRCEASGNEYDGFNYGGGSDFIEIDCTSHHNGLLAGTTNNATTSHGTCRGIRVGGDYDVSRGAVVADVNGARTWNLGCRSGSSTVASGPSWYVDGAGAGYELIPGQMWLDECTADTAPVAVQAAANGKLHLHAFRYSNPTAMGAIGGTVDYY